jgi:2-keto-4-pentenoate hydratase/2-oxohepta-3-ene-1,7-dioic acid hydratase in catechol pathway
VRFASYRTAEGARAAVALAGSVYDLAEVAAAAGRSVPSTLQAFIESAAQEGFRSALPRTDRSRLTPLRAPVFVAPYRRPPKIWGIGLNYRAHAQDLGVAVPEEPASFMKPWTTIIGPGDAIRLPGASRRVTAEAELGLVLGRRCHTLTEREVPETLFGYVTLIDMTAEDILRRNPRFLTRAKSFPTFLSFGPWIVTPDEIPDLAPLRVTTMRNGRVVASNTVSDMAFSPFHLVAFFSRVFEFEPGDLLCTGTPGAAVIEDGDTVGCRIDGFEEVTTHYSPSAWASVTHRIKEPVVRPSLVGSKK